VDSLEVVDAQLTASKANKQKEKIFVISRSGIEVI
jgi:hypothetical protein